MHHVHNCRSTMCIYTYSIYIHTFDESQVHHFAGLARFFVTNQLLSSGLTSQVVSTKMVRSIKAFGATLMALLGRTSSALTFAPRSTTTLSTGVFQLGDSDVVRNSPFANALEQRKSWASSLVSMSAGPAVLDKTVTEKKVEKAPAKEKKQTGNQGWEVRIYNDGKNTREHVARCLVRVTGLTEVSAYETMMQAHQYGMAVVGRWVFERAEMYYEALKGNGIICDMVPVDEDK